jgi:hypothetical protein
LLCLIPYPVYLKVGSESVQRFPRGEKGKFPSPSPHHHAPKLSAPPSTGLSHVAQVAPQPRSVPAAFKGTDAFRFARSTFQRILQTSEVTSLRSRLLFRTGKPHVCASGIWAAPFFRCSFYQLVGWCMHLSRSPGGPFPVPWLWYFGPQVFPNEIRNPANINPY